MGLYKRGQVWWMRFVYEGKQIRQSTETRDRKTADKIYHKVMTQIAEGKWFERLPGEENTFREMIKKYLSEHSARNKAPSSHIRDKGLAEHLLASFADLTIAEITPKLIADYKTIRREEGASPRTVNYELTLMGHAFSLAIKEWEWCRENPVKKVSKEKVNNIIERWMTYEEEQQLLNVSIKWIKPILILGTETGLRQAELLDLRWPNIDLFRRTLTILEQKNKGKDTLPLNKRAMEVLKQRRKLRSIKSDLVFFNRNGNRIDARNLLRAFYSATKKAKIENLRWHDATRHTFATRLAQNGVDIYTIQKLGRWKNISMVMRYAHHYPESLRAGIEVLDKVRKKFSTNLAQSNVKQKVANV